MLVVLVSSMLLLRNRMRKYSGSIRVWIGDFMDMCIYVCLIFEFRIQRLGDFSYFRYDKVDNIEFIFEG